MTGEVMFFRRLGRSLCSVALLVAVGNPSAAQAETTAPLPPDFSSAQYLSISLGKPDDEQGIRLIDGQSNGLTEPMAEGGRRALANAGGAERYIYFDVHNTYINGGFNRVTMTVTYDDVGLTPIDLEYDAYDVVNPENQADAWVKKRINVVTRTNSGGVRTARVVLEDARFGNHQPGGADFRLVASDDMAIRTIALMRSWEPTTDLPIRVVVDAKEVIFDVLPTISPETGTILVPMRHLFGALGVADRDIRWDGATRTVTVQKGETTITLTIDSDVALVKGKAVKLAQPAVIKDGRTLIPLRFVAENLGLSVDWNSRTRLVTISSKPLQQTNLPRPSKP